jgi:hypothetical protein
VTLGGHLSSTEDYLSLTTKLGIELTYISVVLRDA